MGSAKKNLVPSPPPEDGLVCGKSCQVLRSNGKWILADILERNGDKLIVEFRDERGKLFQKIVHADSAVLVDPSASSDSLPEMSSKSKELPKKRHFEIGQFVQVLIHKEIIKLEKRLYDLQCSDINAMSKANKVVMQGNKTQMVDIGISRTLQGHFGKVYSLAWAPDSQHVLSASEDGKLLIWDAFSTNKVQVFILKSPWVMSCAYSPSGKSVASGGLDNIVSIFKVDLDDEEGIDKQGAIHLLKGHEGYIAEMEYVSDNKIMTVSGDSDCIMWDVEHGTAVSTFKGHSHDVSCISASFMKEKSVFVTGSCDNSCKLWDVRDSTGPIMTFPGHEGDVNSVDMFPNGNAFVSGSQDFMCKIWDIRSFRCLSELKCSSSVTSTRFSKSGKFLVSCLDNHNSEVWSVQTGEIVQTLQGHLDFISACEFSPDGSSLCTASWDTLLKVWA